jgi:hypothetical protein
MQILNRRIPHHGLAVVRSSSYYVRSGDGSGGRQLRIQRKAIIAGGEKETVDNFFILEWDPHYSVGWNHQTRPRALDRSSSQEFEA